MTEYPSTEYRLSTLENVLAEFIMQQNRNLARMERDTEYLKIEMKEFKDEMKEFKDEMKEFKDEMKEFKDEMKEFKDEMKGFKDEMKEFKDEMSDFRDDTKDFKDEMRSITKEMNKKWGDLTNKLGTFAEDYVAPNIPRIAKDFFNFSSIDFFVRTFDKRNPKDASQVFEFDVLTVCDKDKKVILTETKFSVRMKYLEGLEKIINNFRLSFPEYKEYQLITIFASMSIAPNQVKYLTSKGIYALASGDSTMDLLNFEELSNK